MTAKKILIVEDNLALLRGLKDNFQAQGYQVRTADDGEKGLAALLRDPPDLLLLDVMLPKVNGYEICRLARSRRLDTPILMLSAKTQEGDVVRGLELGADDYVTKPFGIRELMARARVLCGRRFLTPPRLTTAGAFPLTPTLSRWARGKRGRAPAVSGADSLTQAQAGEGEGSVQQPKTADLRPHAPAPAGETPPLLSP